MSRTSSSTRAREHGPHSGEDLAGDAAADVGEPKVAAAVAVGQPFVIQAHEVQDRGVQVVNMHAIFDRLHAQFVGRTVNEASLDAPAG